MSFGARVPLGPGSSASPVEMLVLDDGQVAEYGTHEELMALGGIYRSIYEKQQLEKQLEEEGGSDL